tara:strand:+ start:364 stop:867 length:504 start_codon:yes stop_codon:yes gene_type:complete
MSKNTGFRGWFYFRQGWSNYFTFIMAAVNTLVVTYYLAIERYPTLVAIFPSFIQYALIIIAIGVPLLVIIGYAHWKKTAARKAEVDIFYEVNPYIMRAIVNTELMLKLNLQLSDLLVKSQPNENISAEDIKKLSNLQKELLDFTAARKFRNKDDWKFFSNIDMQKKK